MPQQPLKYLVERALVFLKAVARSEAIYRPLFANGYDRNEHAKGLGFLNQICSLTMEDPKPADGAIDAARAEIEAWQATVLPLVRIALEHRHPKQCEFVFTANTIGRESQALLAVTLFLDRLDALEKGPQRKASREEDRAALETIARRGCDAAERLRIGKVGALARQLPPPRPPMATRPREEAMLALDRWYREWSQVARVAISRRDYLIQLGVVRARGASESPVLGQ